MFCGMMPDRDPHHGEAFSPLAQLGSQLDKVPRRPLLVSTMAHYNALPLLSLAKNDQGLT